MRVPKFSRYPPTSYLAGKSILTKECPTYTKTTSKVFPISDIILKAQIPNTKES
jgi:hypothetical protein